MKFKVTSIILGLYTLIGVVISGYSQFEQYGSTLLSILLYVLLPAYGTYGIRLKNKTAIIITLVLFLSQSVRIISADALIPHIAPITISIPLGDFSKGQGYLIDFFAIAMVVWLGWLFREVNSANTPTE